MKLTRGNRSTREKNLTQCQTSTHYAGGWVGTRAGLVWAVAENLPPPDRPARSESIPTMLSRLTIIQAKYV